MLISSTNLQVRISQDAHAHPSRRLLFRTASEAGEEIFSICQQSSVWQSSEMGSRANTQGQIQHITGGKRFSS